MTDTKISGLADLGTSPDSGDLVPVVDVSDLSMAASGTNKKVSFSNFLLNYVAKSLYDAQTILIAILDNTPIALTVAEQTVVGRATGGNITALAIDSDLSSVSGADDTVPSAKATKAALDGKSNTGHTHDHGTDLTGLGDDDHPQYLLADGSRNLVKLDLTDSSELTIAAGAITITQSYHRVDTEANAASDDLDTINGGADGTVLYLVAENDARTVVFRHGIGNIVTPDGANFSLDTDDKVALLIYSSAITAWRLVAATGAGGGANTALSNLASVAINESLISDTDNTDNLGSSAIKWANVFTNLLNLEERSAPSTPSSGDLSIFAKTDNFPYFINDGGVQRALAQSFALIEDQKTSGTNGGTFTSGADQTRDLNTEVYDPDGIVSIASNQFTLGAGTYLIEWSAPAYKCGLHQSMLYDVTGTATLARGESTLSSTGDNTQNASRGACVVTPSGSNTYQIRHRCATTQASTGFGNPASFGTEVYTRVKITKFG